MEAEEISRESQDEERLDRAPEQECDAPQTALEQSDKGDTLLDIRKESVAMHSVALKGLFILALFYTFYVARSFLLPIFMALILTFVLSPPVRRLKQTLGLPEGVSAIAILLLIATVLVHQVILLRGPVVEWLDQAPQVIERLQDKLREPLQTVSQATEKLDSVAENTSGDSADESPPVVEVRERPPGWGERLLGWAPVLVGNATATLILLFFFVTYGDLFLLKVVKVLPTLSDKKNAVEIAHQIESQISSYLTTITLINMALGTAIGIAMALWGMPNPLLWGIMGGLLNYIPYLGALVGGVIISVVAFLQFDPPGSALLIPLTYLTLTTLEGYFVTPILLGRRLILNPVVILLGLMFWGWIWNIPGMLLAVPILAVFKIFCDHIKPLAPVGEFLGR